MSNRKRRLEQEAEDTGQSVKAISNSRLSEFADRLETLEEEKRATAEQIKAVLTEAESAGFNKKALQALVKRRLETPEQKAVREQVESDLDIMLSALGMLATTPLGEAALGRHGHA